MSLMNLINPDAILEAGLSLIKDPQLKSSVMETARRYMSMSNPIQAALKGKGLTANILKREGLPLLREGRIAEKIRKIPGSGLLVTQVEKYVNGIADSTPTAAPGDSTPAATSTRAGNPFPPLKPK